MTWFRRGRQSDSRRHNFAVDLPTTLAAAWSTELIEYRVNRREALSVPAVMRARNLITGTLGTLPLHLHDVDHKQVASSLLDQPEPDVPRSVTMTMTFEDLLFEGIAWWRIKRFAWNNYPKEIERCHPSRVAVHTDGSVWIDGQRVPDTELIRFDSPNPALLVCAARAIRTCLRLDAAASAYSTEPMPTGIFTPAEGADPANDATIKEILKDWKSARNKGTTAYVPAALKYEALQWSPADLQLADARNHAVLEIARACGVDAEDLGVSTTSRTYANAETRRLDLLDFTLGAYVNAMQDRLSMNDVTARGYYARFKFDGFLRSDTLTRYTAYEKGLAVGALTQKEIRILEDRPPAPSVSASITQRNPDPVQAAATTALQLARERGITFDAEHQFTVDAHARTVTGLVVPYGQSARSGGRQWQFRPGSLKYSDLKRVKLLRDHEHGQALGVAIKATDTPAGMMATFKIARGSAGDDALALAEDGVLDGFSVGVDFGEGGYEPDPDKPDVNIVTSAAWRETSLTAMPAFDSARVTTVQATRDKDMDMTTDIAVSPPDSTAAFTAALDKFSEVISGLNQREPVSAGKAVGFSVSEPPVYSFTAGVGPSIVRDLFNSRVNRDRDAGSRLDKFNLQIAELTKFATVNRTVGAPVIPPGYRPDLYVPQLFQGRPLYSMLSKGALTDATPFTLPRFGSATQGSADHVEGTNPVDGTLTLQQVTVTPGAISGRFRITREIVDASNPAIDAIAFAAMQESYSQQTESKVYALLNGVNGVGGSITAGSVPSGAAAQAVTGAGPTGAAGVAILDAIRDQLIAYPFRRFAAPNRMALSQEGTTQLGKAKDTTGRPLLPRLGATNASGTVGVLDQSFDVDGLAGVPTWSMSGNAVGDADAIIFNAMDAWAWESSLMTFRYEEVAGPANIDLALFGYFAVQVLRPSGFAGIRLTVT